MGKLSTLEVGMRGFLTVMWVPAYRMVARSVYDKKVLWLRWSNGNRPTAGSLKQVE